MIGQTYLERGQPVVMMIRWANTGVANPRAPIYRADRTQVTSTQAVRNVLIRRPSGSLVVRPFRGLRKVPSSARPSD